MATVPTPATIVAGSSPTAANLNTFRDGANWYLTNRPLFMVRQAVTQSLFTSTWTPIFFTAEDIDRDGGHTSGAGTYTAMTDGWYRASGGVEFASNTTGFRAACFTTNGGVPGGTDTFGYATATPASATQWGVLAGSVLIFLNAGDDVALNGIQSSGGSLSTSTTLGGSWMAVEWVGTA